MNKSVLHCMVFCSVLVLGGCAAAVQHKATITIERPLDGILDDRQVITFVSPKKEDMTYKQGKDGEIEITYSSQSRSLLTRFVEAMSSWVAGVFTQRVGE